MLDARKIQYRAHEYDPAITSAAGVAESLGLAHGAVYKTLVLLREGGGRPMLVMVPGNHVVAPKVLAREVGARAVRMASKSEAEALTGLQTGGIGQGRERSRRRSRALGDCKTPAPTKRRRSTGSRWHLSMRRSAWNCCPTWSGTVSCDPVTSVSRSA